MRNVFTLDISNLVIDNRLTRFSFFKDTKLVLTNQNFTNSLFQIHNMARLSYIVLNYECHSHDPDPGQAHKVYVGFGVTDQQYINIARLFDIITLLL